MKLIYKRKNFATYGTGPHHTVVAIKTPNGQWSCDIEEGDFQTVKDLYKNQGKSNQTVKVFKLD
jgi:hypothetical protein